jgi:hypothetical protein
MKKPLLTIATCLMVSGIFAQKPEKGTVTTELGLSLSSGYSSINTFGINGRYFVKPDLALVLGIGASYSNDVNNFAENTDGTGDEGSFTTKNRYTELALGIQQHFTGTDRLSPFFGVDVALGGESIIQKGDNANQSGYINNYSYDKEYKTAQLGLRLNLGFDYWITEGIYMGAIYRPLSLVLQKQDDITTTAGSNGGSVKTVTPGGTFASLSTFGEVGSIRVGWRF